METNESEEVPETGQAKFERLSLTSKHILGADECGFGSWAGPCLVCAVVVPQDWRPPQGLNDSKKLRPNKREDLFETLRGKVPYSFEMAHSDEIDRDGIMVALHRCFQTCIDKLLVKFPDALVVLDGEVKLPGKEYLHFPKADGIVPAVMAASVIGKVIHDRYMVELGEKYPGYKFGVNAGYGTKDHQEALERKGPCPVHRMSYLPLKKFNNPEDLDEEGIILE
jgi:ribonuclease HII